MKLFFPPIIVLFLLQYASFTFAQNPTTDSTQTLFLLEENGKYGLMDESGKVWLEAKFDAVLFLEEGQTISKATYLDYARKYNPYDSSSFQDENFRRHFSLYPDSNINLICLPKKRNFREGVAHFFTYGTGQVLVKEDKNCYYLDENAKPLFEEVYEDATLFRDGIAAVKKNGRIGVIDSKGNFTLPPRYIDIWVWSQGKIGIKMLINGSYKIKEYDKYGRKIEKYSSHDFLNSHIRLCKDEQEKIGLIDTTTQKIIVPPIYKQAISSGKGTALVLEDKKWTMIDTTGKELIDKKTYNKGTEFQEDFAPIRQSILWTFVNSKGKILGKPRYSKVFDSGFHNGLAKVELGFKQYLIDTTGKILFKYQQIGDPKESIKWHQSDYIKIKDKGLWGVIHKDSLEVLIPPKYAEMEFLPTYGFHFVKLPKDTLQQDDSLWRIIDLEGNEISAPQWEEIKTTPKKELISVKKNGKWGIIDQTGKVIIPPIYESIKPEEKASYYLVWEHRKVGLLDSTGKIILSPQHHYRKVQTHYGNQLIKVQANGKWGFIDFQQKQLLPLEYDYLDVLSPLKFPLFKTGKKDRNQRTYYGLTRFNKKTRKFEELLPPIYTKIEHIAGNLFRLDKNEQYFIYHIPSRRLLKQRLFDKISPYNLSYQNGSIVFSQNNHQGVIDTLGNILIPAQYHSATPFHKNLSKVTLEEKNILIDSTGSVSDTISQILFFAQNSPLKRFRKNGKEGLLNPTTGEIVLPPQYDKIQSEVVEKYECDFVCSNRLAHIYKDGKMGLVTLEGKKILESVYTMIKEQPIGKRKFWLVEKEGKIGLMGEEGTVLLPTQYEDLQYFKFNQCLYRQDGKYGFVRFPDKEMESSIAQSKVLPEDMPTHIPPIFDDFHRHQSFALVKQKDTWRFLKHNDIGTAGEILPKIKFDSFEFYYPSRKPFIAIERKGKWGLYDEDKRELQAITLDRPPNRIRNYFEIVEKGEKYLLDVFGHVMPKGFDEIEPVYGANYSFFKQGDKWGLCSKGNYQQAPKIVLPAEFESIARQIKADHYLTFTKEDKQGFFDINTQKIIWTQDGYAPTKLNEQYACLHKSLKTRLYDLEQEKIIQEMPYESMLATPIPNIAQISSKRKWGLYNLETRKELVAPQFERVNFKNKDEETGQWIAELSYIHPYFFTVINQTGKLIVPPIQSGYFKQIPNGNYVTLSDDGYLVFDSTGKLIDRKPFIHKLTTAASTIEAVKMSDTKKWGFVNENDSLIIPPIFDYVQRASPKLSQMGYLFELQKKGRNGTIDSLGNVQFPPMPYKKMKRLSDNYFKVQGNHFWGLIDSSENVIAEARFQDFQKVGTHLFAFSDKDRWGYMNHTGKIIFPPQFYTYSIFGEEGFAISTSIQRKKGAIHRSGKVVLPMIYDDVDKFVIQNTTCFRLKKDKLYGLADQEGNILLPPIYEKLELHIANRNPIFYQQGWIKCTLNNKITYFNTKGEAILSSNYPETHLISTTSAAVKDTLTNKWGVQNLQTQKWISPPIYDQFQSEGTPSKTLKSCLKWHISIERGNMFGKKGDLNYWNEWFFDNFIRGPSYF